MTDSNGRKPPSLESFLRENSPETPAAPEHELALLRSRIGAQAGTRVGNGRPVRRARSAFALSAAAISAVAASIALFMALPALQREGLLTPAPVVSAVAPPVEPEASLAATETDDEEFAWKMAFAAYELDDDGDEWAALDDSSL